MRTTLDLPDNLYKRAKIVAVERGMTMRMLFTHALAHELNVPVPFTPPPKPEPKYSTIATHIPKSDEPKRPKIRKNPPKTPKTIKPPATEEEEDIPPWLL